LDPVAFRLKNLAEKDEERDRPWSSNHLAECLTLGAEKFGWAKREVQAGSMRDGNELIGWRVAACSWPADRSPCSARVEIRADGTVCASCATQDIGTGTYTVIAQVVSQITGIPIEKVEVKLGDSSLSTGPMSGGSWVTASVMPAVAEATRQALDPLEEDCDRQGRAFRG
jgi:xanthine dehydrogenase YagR molybdenum-binding subunit